MLPLQLTFRNLWKHPLRFVLTVGALSVAIFLLCTLRSLVVALGAGIEEAKSNRLLVQSAVSLFVNLPEAYESKIRAVQGVADVTKWQWFGAYYQEPSNFFAQFAVDPERFLAMYPELEIVDGDTEGFLTSRTGCLVGVQTAEKYGFEVGESIPLFGTYFARTDKQPWSFTVSGIYRSTSPSLDQATLFFPFDYLRESLEAGASTGEAGVGVYSLLVESGADPVRIMAGVDALFENGPQRVQTTTEAAFNAQFVTMLGSVPQFLASIGGGVLIAILLAVVNTMLLAGREQTPDVGVLKALGFSDGAVGASMLTQSLILALLGGGLGVVLAIGSGPMLKGALGTMIQGYELSPATIGMALALSVVIGLLAGALPAWRARGMTVVDALRHEV